MNPIRNEDLLLDGIQWRATSHPSQAKEERVEERDAEEYRCGAVGDLGFTHGFTHGFCRGKKSDVFHG